MGLVRRRIGSSSAFVQPARIRASPTPAARPIAPVKQISHRSSLVAARNRASGCISAGQRRSEEHTSELQSLMRISYAVFCLKKKTQKDSQNVTSERSDIQQH